MHSVTDRRTDGQQAAGNSRSYCVEVRSAKNELLITFGRHIPLTTAIFNVISAEFVSRAVTTFKLRLCCVCGILVQNIS